MFKSMFIAIYLLEIFNCFSNSNPIQDSDTENEVDGGTPDTYLKTQIELLKKQLDALTTRRSEDYKLIEQGLFQYAKDNSLQYLNVDVKEEFRKMR